MICVSFRWNGDTQTLRNIELFAAFGSNILFAAVVCYVGLAFSNVATTLKALSVAVTICAIFTAAAIVFYFDEAELGGVLAIITPIYLFLILAFPKWLGKNAGGQIWLLGLSFLGAIAPLAFALIAIFVFESLLTSTALQKGGVEAVLFFGQFLIAIALIPVMRQMHRYQYEPQES